jgi:hypothetical protein
VTRGEVNQMVKKKDEPAEREQGEVVSGANVAEVPEEDEEQSGR